MQTILLLLVLYKTNWNREVSESKCFSFFCNGRKLKAILNGELLNDYCRWRKLQEGCRNGLDKTSGIEKRVES